MKNQYCICGAAWIEVDSILHSECYYCPECDRIFEYIPAETTREDFQEMYTSDRFEDIKQFALAKRAKEKVTRADLIALGYL